MILQSFAAIVVYGSLEYRHCILPAGIDTCKGHDTVGMLLGKRSVEFIDLVNGLIRFTDTVSPVKRQDEGHVDTRCIHVGK